jgi:glycosyltransferase involved in cell wall biosynthesis
MKTIGYYDDSHGLGGTTRYLFGLINGIDRRKFRIIVFATENREWHDLLRHLDVDIVTIEKEQPKEKRETLDRGKEKSVSQSEIPLRPSHIQQVLRPLAWTAGTLKEINQLEMLFKKQRVDLFHSNHTGAEVAPIAARRAKVPYLIGTWHVDSTYDLEKKRAGYHYRALERLSMLALDHAISVSEATRDDWVRRCGLNEGYQKKISVIYNGIDPQLIFRRRAKEDARAMLGLPQDAIILGSLGRLELAKGYEYLIRALPRVIAKYPRVYLALAGQGPLLKDFIRLSEELKVNKNISFLGFKKDVNEVLECLDIYVQPSLCEAQGIGILEAMSMELPVVGSNIGGIPESIKDSTTGFIVPPRDPEKLAEQIMILVNNPELQKSMGKLGRERIQNMFTTQIMVDNTLALYQRFLKG